MTRGRRLLDIGGGLGFFAGRALEHGWDAYTLDISPAIVERAPRPRRLGSLPQCGSGGVARIVPRRHDVVRRCTHPRPGEPHPGVLDCSLASRSALGSDAELLVSEAVRVDPEARSPGARLRPRRPRRTLHPERGEPVAVETGIQRRAIALPRDHRHLGGSRIPESSAGREKALVEPPGSHAASLRRERHVGASGNCAKSTAH
jgi:hypothetical protein